jgi:predicted PurR-regulated permease PerM
MKKDDKTIKTRIEIDTQTFVRFWMVVIGFALVAFAIYSARTALILIGFAIFLAIALSMPVNRLTKILPGKSRVASTALAYVAIVMLLGVIVFLVIPPILGQMAKFAQTVPGLVDTATTQYAGVKEFIDHYQLQPQVDSMVTSIKDSAAQFASQVGSILVNGIGSLLFTVGSMILVLVLAFLMLIEGPTWLNSMWSLYGNKKRMQNHRKILYRMYTVVTNYVVGQLSVSSIAGVVAGVAVFVLSAIFNTPTDLVIPSAVIVFVTSLVPMFGALIGSILVGLILAINNVSLAIIYVIFSIVYQQIEGNYISPVIQSKRIDLSALALLISLTIGLYLFGIVGGIIAIPIAGIAKVVFEEYFVASKKLNVAPEANSKE